MFKVTASDDLLKYCQELVEKYNFGQRGFADGNKDEQFTGVLGQSVIAQLFNQGVVNGSGGFDGGVDLVFSGLRLDVKTMGRTTDVRDYYVNNFIGLQKDYPVDIYIFCSFNKKNNELTICGWIDKRNLLEKAKFFKRGAKRYRSDGSYFCTKADLYEISNNEIFDVGSFEELKIALEAFSKSTGIKK